MKPTIERICDTIIPTDIKVFYEDGRPYIYYKGKVQWNDIEVEIPKMEMEIRTLESITQKEYETDPLGRSHTLMLPVVNYVLAHHSEKFRIIYPAKKMTKQDIERELGYRVDIVGE